MTNSHALAAKFAEKLTSDFEFETPGIGEPVAIEAVVKTFTKASDIAGLTIHVIPIPPEASTIGDREPSIKVEHSVAVLLMNRREAGKANNGETLFEWHEKHAAASLEIITAPDWNAWIKELSDGAVLSEVETNSVTFDGVGASTIFAQLVVFTVEDSE